MKKDLNIKIAYNGKYPNLCSGELIVTIDGKKWEFPNYCLRSGGSVWFDKGWNEHVEDGDWNIDKWPDNFPEKYKNIVTEKINNEISHGCCGGCV